MRRNRIALLALIVSLSFFAEPRALGQITPDTEWFSCAADEECTIEKDACDAREIVNRKFLNQYRSWKAEIHAVMGCNLEEKSTGSTSKKSTRAICSKGRCSLSVAKLTRAR